MDSEGATRGKKDTKKGHPRVQVVAATSSVTVGGGGGFLRLNRGGNCRDKEDDKLGAGGSASSIGSEAKKKSGESEKGTRKERGQQKTGEIQLMMVDR